MIEGDYALTYNPFLSTVSLLRTHDVPADPDLADPVPAPARPLAAGGLGGGPGRAAPNVGAAAARGRTAGAAVAKKDWFAGAARSSQSVERGLGR